MKNEDIVLIVKNILLKEWDPIVINSNPNLHDEYDNYVMPVINNLIIGITIKELADFLYKIEEEDIGMSGDFNTCSKVAGILKKAFDNYMQIKN